MCTAKLNRHNESWEEVFWNYPEDLDKVALWIERNINSCDMYFCTQLLSTESRSKSTVKHTPVAWTEFDNTVDIEHLDPKPSMVISSSDDRRHVYWRVSTTDKPFKIEELNRRIALHYDANKLSWQLSKVLRIPFTYNFKYTPRQVVKPLVADSNHLYDLSAFKHIPIIKDGINEHLMPDLSSLPSSKELMVVIKIN